VPKLWTETVQTHRGEVRDAILDAAAALVSENGLLSVTMSKVAERTGIGRATLYKYFPDVGSILHAWHARQITGHLAQLADIRDRRGPARERLTAVLRTFAHLSRPGTHDHPGAEIATILHQATHTSGAQQQLHEMVRDLVSEGVAAGDFRTDVTADELATYCLHALTAAGRLPSQAAVHRLVAVTLDGLRPTPSGG
jgi:AcrR family transcriptional regulator